MDDAGDVTADALEDVAYLARSSNRVAILAALAERPHPRHELQTLTDTSRTTLGRILGELEAREWIERGPNGQYQVTAAGRHIATEFMPMVGAMETVRTLGPAIGILPTEALDIDLRHFRDASVHSPNPNDPTSFDTLLARRLETASEFQTLTFFAPPPATGQQMVEAVRDGELSVLHVFAGDLVPYLQGSAGTGLDWTEYLRSDVRLYEYEGRIPCNLFIVDETVFFLNSDSDARNYGTAIESANEAVRAWAGELVDSYRQQAELVDPAAFS